MSRKGLASFVQSRKTTSVIQVKTIPSNTSRLSKTAQNSQKAVFQYQYQYLIYMYSNVISHLQYLQLHKKPTVQRLQKTNGIYLYTCQPIPVCTVGIIEANTA